MAGRLAALLQQTPTAVADGAAPGVEFLRAFATHADAPGAERARDDEGHPLGRLVRAYELTPLDTDLLVLAGMADEHEGFATVFRAVHPRGEPRPTVGLAAQLLATTLPARHLLRARVVDGPLARSGALTLGGDDAPLFERSIAPADTLWPTLAGLSAWPAALSLLVTAAKDPALAATTSAALDGWFATEPVRRAVAALRNGAAVTVLVSASRVDDALHRAAALARHAGVPFEALALPTAMHSVTADVPRLLSLLALHVAARGVVPLLRVPPVDGVAPPALPDDVAGPLLVAARDAAVALGPRPLLHLAMDRLEPAARDTLWQTALPELPDAALLGARYTLEPHTVAAVASDVRAAAALAGRPPLADDLAASVRARTSVAASGGAQLVRPRADWSQLVLPADRLAQLREAVARVAHQTRVVDEWGFLRGRPGARGVRLLFAGPPGTGKTLAAEVMASALGADLLVVDVSRVVSKYIGETEKNLAAVFDAAEQAHAVLLFDEADALFGRRTEVSDAHDRYANLETAYLLQRLERFDGLAILSTNLRDNLDPAFTRRLEFLVDFDTPSATEREALWRAHLPPTAPLADDVRADELAALYPLVGGHIRNAAVAAGFLAAAAGTVITRDDLVRGVRREYEKAGRAFPGAPR